MQTLHDQTLHALGVTARLVAGPAPAARQEGETAGAAGRPDLGENPADASLVERDRAVAAAAVKKDVLTVLEALRKCPGCGCVCSGLRGDGGCTVCRGFGEGYATCTCGKSRNFRRGTPIQYPSEKLNRDLEIVLPAAMQGFDVSQMKKKETLRASTAEAEAWPPAQSPADPAHFAKLVQEGGVDQVWCLLGADGKRYVQHCSANGTFKAFHYKTLDLANSGTWALVAGEYSEHSTMRNFTSTGTLRGAAENFRMEVEVGHLGRHTYVPTSVAHVGGFEWSAAPPGFGTSAAAAPGRRRLVIHEARYGYADPLWAPAVCTPAAGLKDVTRLVRTLVDASNELHINPDRTPQYMNRIFAFPDPTPRVRRLGVRFSYGDDGPISEVTTDGVSQETVALHVTDGPAEEGAPAPPGWVGKLKLLDGQDGNVLRFPDLGAGGAFSPLRCTSGAVTGGIVLEYPETRQAGPWQYTDVGVGPVENAISVRYDGEFVIRDDGRVLDVSMWSYHVHNHLVIVRGPDEAETFQGRGGRGGRSFTLNEDQTLSPAQAPHLALGVVPQTVRVVAPEEMEAAARARREELARRGWRAMALDDLRVGLSTAGYKILDVPDEARDFSSKLTFNGQTFDKCRIQSGISWAPGPKFQQHGPDEYVILDAGAPRDIGGIVISGCGCCKAHASQVRLSVSLQGPTARLPGRQQAGRGGSWIECGDHSCCEEYRHAGDYFDVLEIPPTRAQFVKINPRQWRDGENHAALRCALLIKEQ